MGIKCYTFAWHLLEPSEQSPPSLLPPQLFYTIKSRLKCWLFSNWTTAEQMSIKVASHVRLHSFTTGHLYRLLTRWTTFNLPQNTMVWLRGEKQKHNKTKKKRSGSFDVVWKISRHEFAEAKATRRPGGKVRVGDAGRSGMAAEKHQNCWVQIRSETDSTKCWQ